tara:strand:- start:295 stop:822 length:528 start_codon:yes stop_codon:yes gene_type:complete
MGNGLNHQWNLRMNKKILFCRHAEAEIGYPELHDHDRVLSKRGIEVSNKTSTFLLSENINPDIYISSSASRAIETCSIIKAENDNCKTKIFREIYTQGLSGIEDAIRGVSDVYKMIALFGHNPSLSQIYNNSSNTDNIDLPPSGIYIADIDISSWANFKFPYISIEMLITPNNIK